MNRTSYFSIKIPKWREKSNSFYSKKYHIISHRKLSQPTRKKLCLIELHTNSNKKYRVAVLVITDGVKGKVKIKKCENITQAVSTFDKVISKKKEEGYI